MLAKTQLQLQLQLQIRLVQPHTAHSFLRTGSSCCCGCTATIARAVLKLIRSRKQPRNNSRRRGANKALPLLTAAAITTTAGQNYGARKRTR